jgi:hypothetical protein
MKKRASEFKLQTTTQPTTGSLEVALQILVPINYGAWRLGGRYNVATLPSCLTGI